MSDSSKKIFTHEELPSDANLAYFWYDQRLMKSSIFRKRINTAASKIQALIRGFVTRRKVANPLDFHTDATITQSTVPVMEPQQKLFREKSAVRIQTVYRRHYYRTLAKIHAFECAIETTEYQKERDLQDIHLWCEQELENIEDEIRAVTDGLIEQDKTLSKIQRKSKKLRQSNKELREENESLAQSIEELFYDNINIERLIKEEAAKSEEIKKRMAVLEEENKQLEWCLQEMAEYEKKYQDVLDHSNRCFAFEETVKRMVKDTACQIIFYASDNNMDTELVDDLLGYAEELGL